MRLTADGHWVGSRKSFLFPVRALSKVFRGQYLQALGHAREGGVFQESAWTRQVSLYRRAAQVEWVVYAKPPFGGPEHVIAHPGRYTRRIAL